MRRITAAVLGAVLAAAGMAIVTATPAAAVTPVDYTCTTPSGASGLFAGQVPSTVTLAGLPLNMASTPSTVAPGGTVHYDLDVPFPDVSTAIPDLPFDIGYIYLKQIDYTLAIPTGINANTVTTSIPSPKSWASVSRVGSNVVYHIASAFSGSRIRLNGAVTPTTVEVQETDGSWVPLTLPRVSIDGTVNAAAGSTIQWKPPSIVSKVKFNLSIPVFITINWNDVDEPCTANAPVPTIATTTVGSPALSVTTTADETSVVAGSSIHLHTTATNTGNMALTGVVITDANAPGCAGTVGALAVGAHATLDCTVTTSAANVPTFTNTAGADSNETAPVTSSPVSVSVTAPAPTGISGTVTDSVSGAVVPGAWVAILRSSDFAVAGSAVADGSGDFSATVASGSYFLYLLDPAGRHSAGFSSPNPVVTVGPSGMVDADRTLVPTRGTVNGTITDSGSGTPIPGAWMLSLTSGGVAETATLANGSGQFSLGDLIAGNHFVGYVDPTGAHASRFYPNSPNVPDATHVAVTAGGTTTANAALPAQTAIGTGATLTGTITETGTGTPLADARVIALRSSDFTMARGTITNASGAYSLDVAPGSYHLAVLDGTGTHAMEWFDNVASSDIANATSVTAPGTANAALDRTTGAISGTVTDDPAGTPLSGAWVIAIGARGIEGAAVTAADGTYSIGGLPVGSYRVAFADPPGGHTQEYWNGSSTYDGATPVTVTAGATSAGVNAALAHP